MQVFQAGVHCSSKYIKEGDIKRNNYNYTGWNPQQEALGGEYGSYSKVILHQGKNQWRNQGENKGEFAPRPFNYNFR